MNKPIIESILDSDLYKFSMQQWVRHNAPRLKVEYDFKCRNAGVDLSPYADEIRAEIDHYCTLSLTDEDVQWLEGNIKYLSSDYIRSLRDLRLCKDCVQVSKNGEPFTLTIKGNWYETILFEVPVLAIINEVYFRNITKDVKAETINQGRINLRNKIHWLKENCNVPFNLMEFGTRRRFSGGWQDEVVDELKSEFDNHPLINFSGTSNVALAKKYYLRPMGTMAHEYLQAHQVLAPIHHFQSSALQGWADEYRGNLGIALSDIIGFDAFLRDFHRGFAMLYAGCRHDSGDPYVWGDKLITHYKNMDIDPMTKTAVFSDGLNVEKAVDLARYFNGKIKTQFGLGTSLSNDMGVKPLNIVIKMTRADGMPVAKLADGDGGKEMCKDPVYMAWIKQVRDRKSTSLTPRG